MAIDRLAEAPGGPGTRPRDDVAAGLRSLHLAVVARRRRSARHVLLFRLLDDEVVIVRVLHERMQLKADRVQDR
jgi:toxin ParE1/3/4